MAINCKVNDLIQWDNEVHNVPKVSMNECESLQYKNMFTISMWYHTLKVCVWEEVCIRPCLYHKCNCKSGCNFLVSVRRYYCSSLCTVSSLKSRIKLTKFDLVTQNLWLSSYTALFGSSLLRSPLSFSERLLMLLSKRDSFMCLFSTAMTRRGNSNLL